MAGFPALDAVLAPRGNFFDLPKNRNIYVKMVGLGGSLALAGNVNERRGRPPSLEELALVVSEQRGDDQIAYFAKEYRKLLRGPDAKRPRVRDGVCEYDDSLYMRCSRRRTAGAGFWRAVSVRRVR